MNLQIWALTTMAVLAPYAFLVACSDDDNSASGASNLTMDERAALHQLSSQLASEYGWSPAVPLYIPDGLMRYPYESEATESDASFAFNRADARSEIEYLTIVQSKSQPVDPSGSSSVEIADDVIAWTQSSFRDEEHTFYTLNFSAEGRSFFVSAIWETSDGSPSDEQKEVTHRIAASLVDDLQARSD